MIAQEVEEEDVVYFIVEDYPTYDGQNSNYGFKQYL
jgi:hypothetical protein